MPIWPLLTLRIETRVELTPVLDIEKASKSSQGVAKREKDARNREKRTGFPLLFIYRELWRFFLYLARKTPVRGTPVRKFVSKAWELGVENEKYEYNPTQYYYTKGKMYIHNILLFRLSSPFLRYIFLPT